ncbi:MAG: glycoside hydrolase family 1 protein [Candidatus Omnitrophica bacterium]|nr:glycoside hydrolase family 1 protein [Candidatus Omnitrophota bacterium]
MLKPIWGAVTSAHQVEGNNRWNDWWAWEELGKVKECSLNACDQYRLFAEDFQLAKSLGHTAHRFSIEWSRLEPEEGHWNEEGFRHYEKVFDCLESQGLEPVVTLHHFTNPIWFARRGGWLQKNAAERFALYVTRVAERFGRRVRIWITLNEPLIYIYQSFIVGIWPPGEKSLDKGLNALRQLLKAHVLAYQILHEYARGADCSVSIAQHTIAFTPCNRKSPFDRLSLFFRSWFVNQLILRSLLSGFLFFPGVFCEKLPARKSLDFLGINYYSRDFVRFQGLWGLDQFGAICPKSHHGKEVGEINDLGWEIYPRGIYEIVTSYRDLKLPILITENGVCSEDDSLRQRYIEAHLAELEKAKKEGIPILGYLYWSLVDNFEWAEGFKPRFGIVEVDYTNQSRRVRPSAQVLRKSCEQIFGRT